tara:strand:- start:138897 stop:139826 length:930 start_codon:yes stop_codon:yes gene_type:complete
MPEAVKKKADLDFNVKYNPSDSLFSKKTLINKSNDVDGILICSNDKIDKSVINDLPSSVKIISCYTAGYENIDFQYAAKRGITVTNSPDSVTIPTAEIAMLLILGTARRAVEADNLIRQNQWSGWHTEFMLGQSLSGKRLGILGMGRIGRALAERARGFGLEIHYHNRSRLPESLELGANYHETNESLLKSSDILSLNCSLTETTRNFLNSDRILMLPKGAIVINTSRGEVIDDEALINALETNQIYAAGLDVFCDEPNVEKRYIDLSNTFLLPHIGSATFEGRNGMGFQALENLKIFFAGISPPNKVN